jgi:hypothetical protein
VRGVPVAGDDVIENRHRDAAEERCGNLPHHQRQSQPLEDGVEQDHERPDDDRRRRQQHRPEANCPGVDDGVLQPAPLPEALLDEVDQDDRVAHHDPRSGDEADHGRGSEERAEQPVPGQDADQRQRDRHHDDQRDDERLEPADDQHVDENEHQGECNAEVAEHLIGDVPLSVPLHRQSVCALRQVGRVTVDGIPLGGLQLGDPPVQGGDGVDRALDRPRQVGQNVDHPLEVLVQDHGRLGAGFDSHQVPQADHRVARRGEAQLQRWLQIAVQRRREADMDRHRLALTRRVQQPGVDPADRHLHRLDDVRRGDTMQ